jgi:hypothetical protein
MSFLNSLTEEQKQEILQEVISSKAREIFRLCVHLGMDTDAFNAEEYESPNPVVQHETILLEQACKAYIAAKAKAL